MKNMSKFFASCLLFISLVFFVSCQSIPKEHSLLIGVDESTIIPAKIFEHNNTVYFVYEDGENSFFLSADLPRVITELIQAVDFNVETEVPGNFDNVTVLPDITEYWEEAITDFAMEIAPKNPSTGVTITVFTQDGLIFKDHNGALKFIDLKYMPSDIDIIRNVKHEEFIEYVSERMVKIAKEEFPGQTKFIVQMKDIPLVPFAYFDIEEQNVFLFELPSLYKIKKDILPLGYTTKIVYSVFVKSHIFPAIKAPFTTVHRLINQTFVSLETIVRPMIKDTKGEIPPVNEDAEYMDTEEFNEYLDKKVTDRVYKAKITTLIDGEEFFSHFQVNAAKAEKSILIRLYVFSVDPYTLGLADMLKLKSNEGVKVNVLLDEMNMVFNWSRDPAVLSDRNYKMPNIKKYLKKDSRVKVRTHPNTWINFAHTKVIVIDEKLAYTGGMNFAEDYRYFWHDAMFALEGPIVARLRNDFKQAWLFAGIGGDFSSGFYALTKKEKEYEGSTDGMADVRILYTSPSFTEIYDAQVAAIKRARKRIYIQNPYFSDPKIINELIRARARGVDVKVILPAKNNVGLMYKNNMIKTNTLIRNGIRVFMYRGMTHVKAGIYDDWACVGSANMDRYSLHLNQEMNIATSDPQFLDELEEKLFIPDFANSDEVTEPFVIAWSAYVASAFNPMK